MLIKLFQNVSIALAPAFNKDLKVTQFGKDLVAKYEGLGPKGVVVINGVKSVLPYICPSGKPTLGRGRVISWSDYEKYKKTGIPLTLADQWFEEDMQRFGKNVAALIKVPVQEWQFDALVSLAYNIGVANLKSSTLLRKLNLKDYAGAANEFPRWIYSNKRPLDGLRNRRESEKRMFLNNPPRPIVLHKTAKTLIAHQTYMFDLTMKAS